MRATILGLGKMGVAIAYGMRQLGFELFIAEPEQKTLDKNTPLLEKLKVKPKYFKTGNDALLYSEIHKEYPDIVISAMPYWANLPVAKTCAKNGWRYCDLGGNPEYSQKIMDIFQEANTGQAFTDLGLAPGFANIVAEQYILTDTLNIFVGGLPKYPNNTLKYNLVFSVDGLVNEYVGDCSVLKDGKIESVPALSSVEDFGEEHECFYTKGGLSHSLQSMLDKGVKNCAYKTIRYKGHAKLIKFLRDECSDRDNAAFGRMLSNACRVTSSDVTIIGVNDGHDFYKTKIYNDENFTAMQKATAFPTAVVAAIMAKGICTKNQVLKYSDVPIKPFFDKLNQIDMSVDWELKKEEKCHGI